MYCRNCGQPIAERAEFCTGCGVKPGKGKGFCHSCGARVADEAEICVKCGVKLFQATGGVSPKSRTAAAVLAFFLGQLGLHRFYSGKIGTGVAMLVLTIIGYSTIYFGVGLVFLLAVGIWNLVDLILILAGRFKDKNNLLITRW